MDKERSMDREDYDGFEVTGHFKFTAAPTPQLHSSVAEALAESKNKVPRENDEAFSDESATAKESSIHSFLTLNCYSGTYLTYPSMAQ